MHRQIDLIYYEPPSTWCVITLQLIFQHQTTTQYAYPTPINSCPKTVTSLLDCKTKKRWLPLAYIRCAHHLMKAKSLPNSEEEYSCLILRTTIAQINFRYHSWYSYTITKPAFKHIESLIKSTMNHIVTGIPFAFFLSWLTAMHSLLSNFGMIPVTHDHSSCHSELCIEQDKT